MSEIIQRLKEKDAESKDLVAENIGKLKQLFPEIVTDGKVDFETLQEVLGDFKEESQERYSFTWNGKSKVRKLAMTPSRGTLRPAPEESVNWDSTDNLFIEGDNLEVLKLLQRSYHGKIKMIYIDPPYNTGSDFIYKDDYKDNLKNYLNKTGQLDDEGRKLSSNPEYSGRFHTDWLDMMYPRLLLSRELLMPDGLIFISIDDNEVHNLIRLCNDVFGESNFLNLISVKAKPSAGASGGGEDKRLKKNLEYLLCYVKDRNSFSGFNEVYDEIDLYSFIEDYREEGKSWKYTRVLDSFGDRSYYKTIKDGSDNDIKIFKHENVIFKTVKELAKEDEISEEEAYNKYFDKIFRDTNAQSSIRQRVLDATDNEDTFYSIEYEPISGRNKGEITTLHYKGRKKDLIAWLSDVADKREGKAIKKEMVGTLWDTFNWNNISKEGSIQYPNGKKPINFIKRMIELSSSETKDDLILDFFAGSGSTAHAVMDLNNNDSGNRKSLSIQLPEQISKKDKKEYYSSSDLNHIETVADVYKERMKRAIKSYDNQHKNVGFKAFKLNTSNLNPWNPTFDQVQLSIEDSIENIKSDRSEQDVLYEILLKYGLDLSLPIEEKDIAGSKVFVAGAGALFICLAPNIDLDVVEGIAKQREELEPELTRVVFRDSGFKDDVVKTNAVQILKQHGIEDVRSI